MSAKPSSLVPREASLTPDPYRAAVRIIADYMLRFMRNNPDSKLYEARARLEKKVTQFMEDGCEESLLRASLEAALRSHTKLGLIQACDQLVALFSEA